MKHPIYTIGYNAGWTVPSLWTAIQQLGALLFDIRYSAWSSKQEWRQEALQSVFGDTYRHVRAMGNINFRGSGIVIANLPKGLTEIEQAAKPIVLMCACEKATKCHRTVVARALQERGHTVTELLPAPEAHSSVALSIRQPWAWLIVNGYKDIENRGWATAYRGRFYVHAPATFDSEGYQWVRYHFPAVPLPAPASFRRGGLVGSAELIDIVTESGSPWFCGSVGFVLSDAKPRPFVQYDGKQGFFRVYGV